MLAKLTLLDQNIGMLEYGLSCHFLTHLDSDFKIDLLSQFRNQLYDQLHTQLRDKLHFQLFLHLRDPLKDTAFSGREMSGFYIDLEPISLMILDGVGGYLYANVFRKLLVLTQTTLHDYHHRRLEADLADPLYGPINQQLYNCFNENIQRDVAAPRDVQSSPT
jgi:hypothetical protein